MRTIGLLLVAGLLAASVSAQTQEPQTTGTAAMSGRVVDAETGQPVPGAIVKIGPRAGFYDQRGKRTVFLTAISSSDRLGMTDVAGRFVFEELAPGMPIIVVDAPGYLVSAYGQHGPDTPVRQVHIADGQRLTDLVIRAWRGGVITGIVRDEAGEPVVDAPVQILRRRFEAGARRLVADADTRTDDRGLYRLPGLRPGEYAVAVGSTPVTVPMSVAWDYQQANADGQRDATRVWIAQMQSLGVLPASPGVAVSDTHVLVTELWPPSTADPGPVVYPTTFHPGTRDPGQATLVRVTAAGETPGVDLRLVPARAFQVAGHVTSPSLALGGVRVSIRAPSTSLVASGSEFEVAVTQTADDGSFLFAGVPEGQYVLRALKAPLTAGSYVLPDGQRVGWSADLNPDASTLWAERPISIGGHDVLDLSVALRSGLHITGRIEFEGTTERPEASRLRFSNIRLIAADGRSPSSLGRTTVAPDHTFATAEYPPGRYHLAASPIGSWSVRSIVVNGRDALLEPVELSTRDVANAVVTYAEQPLTLFGSVTLGVESPEHDPGAIVVLFPVEYRLWIDGGMNPLLLHTALTYRDGTFRIPRLVAGEYLLAAYDADAGHDPEDPDVLLQLAPQATRVTLTEPTTSGVVIRRRTVR